MNEQIVKLGLQAGLYADLNGSPYPCALSAEESVAAHQKFAELIVRECMNVCESATQEGQSLHLVSLGYSQRIKEHFGVE